MSEKSLREQLVGAWALTSCVERDIETGVETHPLGERPLGLILYTPDGYVSAQLQPLNHLRLPMEICCAPLRRSTPPREAPTSLIPIAFLSTRTRSPYPMKWP
jgi:Lipocalin-like domain